MHKRETPRRIRETPRYFQFEYLGELFTFRLPGPKVINSIYTPEFLRDVKAITALGESIKTNPRELTAEELEILAKSHDIKNVTSALVASCWYHENYDLDTQIENFKSVYDYGRAVAIELDEEFDLSPDIIEKISAHIVVLLNDRNQEQEAVAEKIDFFPATTKGKKKH